MRRAAGFSFAILLLFSALPAEATIIIDNFDTGTTSLSTTSGTVTQAVNGTTIIGGERDVILTVDNPDLPNSATAFNNPPDNVFSYSNPDAVDGKLMIIWDGDADGDLDADNLAVDTTGLLSADLTVGGSFQIVVNFINVNVPIDDVSIQLWDSNSNDTVSSGSLAAGAQEVVFSFASYSGIDFTDIGAIKLTIDSGIAGDARFNLVIANTPEPSSMALLAMGGLSLVAAGYKRRRKLAA